MPLPTPTIRIKMTGLLVLNFELDPTDPSKFSQCRILVHRLGADHSLRMNVYHTRALSGDPPASDLVLELAQQLVNDIDLTVSNPATPASGVIKYPQDSGDFALVPDASESPFSIVPDIEGLDFHNIALPPAPRLPQFIRIHNGVFYALSEGRVGWILRAKGTIARYKAAIGIDVGVNIYLSNLATSKAQLKWGTRDDQKREFVNEAGSGYLHVIEILNDCATPSEDTQGEGVFETDFRRYYEVLDVPDLEDQFNLVLRKKRGGLSPDHPCGPITGGQTH